MELNCPIPITDYDRIVLAHGSGGKLMHQLIEKMFYPEFKNEWLSSAHDGAVLKINGKSLAFTTDSFVVSPLFFPGGDIGDLAINGTVNDLVCCGAIPKYISLAFIIEEGFLMTDLWRIILSIKVAAEKANVHIVTGDTKVVEKGKGDGIFINTSGIGEVVVKNEISPKRCMPGDVVIINGSIADHGISILTAREDLQFESEIKSDTASLNQMMEAVFKITDDIHVMRDPTRGGLASTLNEIAHDSASTITIFEKNLKINESVAGACELLGFDPLYVANEGKLLIIVPKDKAEIVLNEMRKFTEGKDSSIIGEVNASKKGRVQLKTIYGTKRIVDTIVGDQLPRIC